MRTKLTPAFAAKATTAADAERTTYWDTGLPGFGLMVTANGHRIHYDQNYARAEENYPDLVVHGPLTATLLQGFAAAHAGRPLREFEFRGMSPLFVSAPFKLEGKAGDRDALELWASGPSNALAMRASAKF